MALSEGRQRVRLKRKLEENHNDKKTQKRQLEEIISPRSPKKCKLNNESPKSIKKFSANDRLKCYRKTLEKRQNEIVKVHQINIEYNEPASPVKTQLNRTFPLQNRQKKSGTSILKLDSNKKLNLSESNIANTIDIEEDFQMEWSPIEETTIISDIQKVREGRCGLMVNSITEESITTPRKINSNVKNNLFIIVDTNVFLSDIKCVTELIKNCDAKKFTVYVPWMVIQELDYFKDGRAGSRSLQELANKAVKFINEQLTSTSSNLIGQTVQDALKDKFLSSNSDDGILNCCLQLKERGHDCALLSNDVNLRNKLLINGIRAFDSKNFLLQNICNESNFKEDVQIQRISAILSNLCNAIIVGEMKETYGDVWNKMKFMKDHPWNLIECLDRIKYYWGNVYSDKMQKQCIKIIDDLITFSGNWCSNTSKLTQFVELCLSLCVYLKNGLPLYIDSIGKCIKDIQEVVN